MLFCGCCMSLYVTCMSLYVTCMSSEPEVQEQVVGAVEQVCCRQHEYSEYDQKPCNRQFFLELPEGFARCLGRAQDGDCHEHDARSQEEMRARGKQRLSAEHETCPEICHTGFDRVAHENDPADGYDKHRIDVPEHSRELTELFAIDNYFRVFIEVPKDCHAVLRMLYVPVCHLYVPICHLYVIRT